MKQENGKGGIDYIRYREEVVKPLVIPFIAEIDLQRPYDPNNLDIPGFIFQQDNAPSHKSYQTLEMLYNAGIEILEHPSNSPNMNAIKKAQMPIRIAITNVWNRPYIVEQTKRAWYAKWEAIEQDEIREWVHRMIKVNQEILDHEGGNEFYK